MTVMAAENNGRKRGVVAAMTTRYGVESASGACLDEHMDNEGGIAGSGVAIATNNDKGGT